jgi:DNA-binding NtrC family response regulator
MSKPVILLIDDDKTMLNSLMDQLRNSFKGRYMVEAAQTIVEARELVESLLAQGLTISLIISDWLMPPDRTNDFLEEIHKAYPEIVLIMLSGYADEASVEQARQRANLQGFMRKPWDEEELVAEVKRVLNIS